MKLALEPPRKGVPFPGRSWALRVDSMIVPRTVTFNRGGHRVRTMPSTMVPSRRASFPIGDAVQHRDARHIDPSGHAPRTTSLGTVSTWPDFIIVGDARRQRPGGGVSVSSEHPWRTTKSPWGLGHTVSHRVFRYLIPTCSLSTSPTHLSTRLLQVTIRPATLRSGHRPFSEATVSVHPFSPVYFRRTSPRPVLYYEFILRWLLPSLRPGCLRTRTSLGTQGCLGTLTIRLSCFSLDDDTWLSPSD